MQDSGVHRRTFLQGFGGATLLSLPGAVSGTDGAYFSVSVDHSPDVVDEGDTSTVDGTITNTGDESGIQTVELEITSDGEVFRSQAATVPLGPGDSVTRTETVDYEEYPDPGEYVVEICSDDECATDDWTVVDPDGPPFFEVVITDTTEPTTGDPLTATADVSNLGGETGTQSISLLVDGLGEDATTVELASDETRSVSLSVPTETGDTGDYTATVESEDDSDSAAVTVRGTANFAVDITGTTSPAVEGDPLAVDAAVENTGDASATQSIELSVGDETRDSTALGLDGGADQSVTLEWQTADGDAGDYTATVATDDDSDTAAVSVREPATFAVDITGTNAPVVAGDPLTVDATVENTDDVTKTQSIRLAVDGTERDATEVTLDGGDSAAVTLTWDTADGDAGDYTAVVTSEDGEARTAVEVVEDESELGPPPVVGDDPPRDLTGDGLYRDINGDGEFTIADVQLFFQYRDSDAVQNNAEDFNFAGDDPPDVTIGDVQILFQEYLAQR